MTDFLLTIDDYLLFMYLPVLLAGLLIFKRLNSFNISALVVTIMEPVMHRLREPLRIHILQDTNIIKGRIEWFGTWIVADLIALYLLVLLHQQLQQSDTRLSVNIKRAYMCSCALQVLRYLDKTWGQQTNLFKPVYQLGVPAIGIAIGLMLIASLLQQQITKA